MKEKGILHKTTVPYNPPQNGVSERMNHTIVETAQSTMSHLKMPIELWAEAVNTATYDLHFYYPTDHDLQAEAQDF